MPNVILEHSKDIKETKELMQLCHDHIFDSGLFKIETIKVRPIVFSEYLVGGSSENSFLVITLTVMPGKSNEQKAELGDSLHQKIIKKCKDLDYKAATSVVVKETPEGLYFKQNN